ncbi:Ribonuclease P/MRP protein subunit POP5 [Orchesella cincta]|uniref:Ribonuclease P/MRP protein subunit POP5 n=1 Tax=Orchesella cincta TaxID=48709 RepID=A0A1D2MUL8_ORCCI|nr:Ribonuclease P/MRP protein subunit POP5 [Orchesella cincta]
MVRLRHRYLVTEYSVTDGRDSEADNAAIRSSSVLEALTNSIRRLHGVHGVAVSKAGLLVKYINNSTQILFIRMRRSACSLVSSAIPFIRQVDGKSVTFRTIYTGATINHCNKFLVKYQRKILQEQYGSLKTDLQRQYFQRDLDKLKPYSVQLGST